MNRYLSYIHKASRIVDEVKPDIVLVCDDGFKGLYVPFWLRTSAKLVYERHAALAFNSDFKLVQEAMKYASKKYDNFVVLTSYYKKEWGADSNITVILNPLANVPYEQSNLNHGIGIWVGSLNYNKGFDLLIDALA